MNQSKPCLFVRVTLAGNSDQIRRDRRLPLVHGKSHEVEEELRVLGFRHSQGLPNKEHGLRLGESTETLSPPTPPHSSRKAKRSSPRAFPTTCKRVVVAFLLLIIAFLAHFGDKKQGYVFKISRGTTTSWKLCQSIFSVFWIRSKDQAPDSCRPGVWIFVKVNKYFHLYISITCLYLYALHTSAYILGASF